MMLSVESSNKRSAAEQVIDKCTDLGEDVKSSLGSCSYAIWTWADAEYFVSAQDFMPESKPQTSEESDRLNLKKRDSDSGFPAPVFPPRFSPAGVCSESLKWMPNKNGLQPVFSGEAFGDVSWVDVSNLRTRHLSAISLLETLENGKAFQRRHPEGLSRVAVNLGGSQCWGGSGGRPRYFLTIVFFFVQHIMVAISSMYTCATYTDSKKYCIWYCIVMYTVEVPMGMHPCRDLHKHLLVYLC